MNAGESVDLTANAGDGTPGYTYLWSNGSTQQTQTVTPTTNTTYGVTVTDAAGCTAVDELTVTVWDTDLDRLIFFDHDTQSEYASLNDGDVFNFFDLPDNFTIEALTNGTIGSVRFNVNGDLHTEFVIPYRYGGDSFDWDPATGYLCDYRHGFYTQRRTLR